KKTASTFVSWCILGRQKPGNLAMLAPKRSDRQWVEETMHGSDMPSVLDLFAAPGGLSLGFQTAGYRIVAALDNDKWGCQTLIHNFAPRGTLVIQGDVESVSVKGRVDVVVGGPPCQSFSIAGRAKIRHLRKLQTRERFIDDSRNRLYKHFVKAVQSLRPQFF